MARARRLAVPAEWTGSGRADDPGRARSAWAQPRRTGRPDALPSAHRGRALRLPRPQRLPRRPAPSGDAGQPPPRPRLPRCSRATDRRQARASRIAAPLARARSSRMATPSRSRSSTATATPAASSTRSIRTSAAALSAKAPACSCRTEDCASPSSAVTRTLSRPTRAPPTPSCPAWRHGTAGLGCASA